MPLHMPRLVYGTAWKKDATADLVFRALKAGFRGVDTAAQPKHYNEALVGVGIRNAISQGIVRREEVFIQTKFSPVNAQDLNDIPYDPKKPLAVQVQTSVAQSLENFTFDDPQNAYIDSLVLHSPPPGGFSALLEVWTALESYVPNQVRQIGISNVDLPTLERLCTSPDVIVRPAVVQNRFYSATQWEVYLRAFCRRQAIAFQAFWVLTGNPGLMRSTPVQTLARRAGVSQPAALYALVMALGGITVLDGTTDEKHMAEDLKVERVMQEFVQQDGSDTFLSCLDTFKAMIGEQE